MPQFIVAIHHLDNYDPSKEDSKMHHDIDMLNEAMESKGFVSSLADYILLKMQNLYICKTATPPFLTVPI